LSSEIAIDEFEGRVLLSVDIVDGLFASDGPSLLECGCLWLIR
jgi:hypothetical protein